MIGRVEQLEPIPQLAKPVFTTRFRIRETL
jgi:hypothetical protein